MSVNDFNGSGIDVDGDLSFRLEDEIIEYVPEEYVKVYDFLISLKLPAYFTNFVREEFDDLTLSLLDPDCSGFWIVIAKILPKAGPQIKFQDGLRKYRKDEGFRGAEIEENSDKNDDENWNENKIHYKHFNEYENLQDIINAAGEKTYFMMEKKPNQPLSNAAQKKLVKIIVEWTARNFIKLTPKDFLTIFKKIESIFPHEKLSFYYVQKGDANPNPSGLLYNSYKKRHETIKRENISLKMCMPERSKKSVVPLNAPIFPDDMEVVRQRLIHRSEPWVSVMEDWKYTFEYRRFEADNKTMKLDQFLMRWSKFQQKRGVQMIESDFDEMYPNKRSILFQEIKEFADEILNAAYKKGKTDKNILQEDLHSFLVTDDSPFYYTNVLKALVYHLPGPPRKTIEHGPKRFLKLVQTMEFNDDIIEKTRRVAAAKGKKDLHPFIVIAVTSNLPVAYYLSLFDAIFKFDSLLGAFDILFQSLFVLRISYPEELFSFFTFIQMFLYKINTPNDRTIGNVTKLIKNLDYNRLA